MGINFFMEMNEILVHSYAKIYPLSEVQVHEHRYRSKRGLNLPPSMLAPCLVEFLVRMRNRRIDKPFGYGCSRYLIANFR